MQPDAEGQALQAKECPPKRKFTQSKSLSRLAASSSDQGTVLSKSGVQLENRSASTRVSKSAWDIPSPPAPDFKPPAWSGLSEPLRFESWQPQLRSGSPHFRGPPSVGSTATSAPSSASGFRCQPLRSSSAGQLYLPATFLTIDPGSETTHPSMSSNSAAPERRLDSSSWVGTLSTRDKSSQPSHKSQSTNSRSTYHSGNSQPTNSVLGPPQHDQQSADESSFSFRSFFCEHPQQQQQQQHSPLPQPYLLGEIDGDGDPAATLGEGDDSKAGVAYAGAPCGFARRVTLQDLAESSRNPDRDRDTLPGRDRALEPHCVLSQAAWTTTPGSDCGRDPDCGPFHSCLSTQQVHDQPSFLFRSSNSSRMNRMDSRESFQDAASNFEASTGYSSSSPEEEGDMSDAPPPSAFSIMAAAFGWSVEHAPEGGLPAPVEGDMFGQPTPAEQEVLGRSGPLADHTWEEQQHQTNLRWLAETRTLQRRGPPCEDARQAERSSTFVNQVGDAWGPQSPLTAPLYRGSSLQRSSGSNRSSVPRASHRGGYRPQTRSLSKQGSGHSRRGPSCFSPPRSPEVATMLQAAQQQRGLPRPASANCLLQSGAPSSNAPPSSIPFTSAPSGSTPLSSSSCLASGSGTGAAALHAWSLGFATSPAAIVPPSICNSKSNSNNNNNNNSINNKKSNDEHSSSNHACAGQQSPCRGEGMSEYGLNAMCRSSLPLRSSPTVSEAPPSHLSPSGPADHGLALSPSRPAGRSSAPQAEAVQHQQHQHQQHQLLCTGSIGRQQSHALDPGLGDNDTPQGSTTATTAATNDRNSTLAEAASSSRGSSLGAAAQEQTQPLSSARDSAAQALFIQTSPLRHMSSVHTSSMLTAPPSAFPHATTLPSSLTDDTGSEPGGRPAGPPDTGSAEVPQASGAQQNSGPQGILCSRLLERSLSCAVGGSSRTSRSKRRSAGVRFKISSPSSSGRRAEPGDLDAPERKDSTDIASKDMLSSSPSRPSPWGGSESEESAGVHPDFHRVRSGPRSLERLQELGSKKLRAKHMSKSSGAPTAPTSVDSFPDAASSGLQSPQPRRPLGPSKSYSMPKQLPYYSDLARHQGRYKVLLVTSDGSKAAAIHMALPPARYELIVASTKGQCMSSIGAKYMPDILLLDSRWRAAQATPESEELEVSTESLRSGKLERHRREHRQQSSPALQLLATLRAYHDPSALPIILLAAASPPHSATASIAAAVLKDSASRARAAAPTTATTATTSTIKTATSHGPPPWSPAQSSQGPASLTSQGRGPSSWSLAHTPTPAAPVSADTSHSAPLPVFSSTAPHAAFPTAGQKLATAVRAKAAATSLAAPLAASGAAVPSHQFSGLLCMPEVRDLPVHFAALLSPRSSSKAESWLSKTSVDTLAPPLSPQQPTFPSTAAPTFVLSNDPMQDPAVQHQLGLPTAPPTTAAAAQGLHGAPVPSRPLQSVSAPHPAGAVQATSALGHPTCGAPFPSSAPSTTGAPEQTPLAEPAFTPSAAQEGVAALRQGANDYVTLPMLDPAELEARISMQVALRRAVRIKAEASSSMQLLRSMLPSTVIRRLKAGQTYIAQRHEEVTIGFIDVVGFTDMSAHWSSSKVAQMLNDLFSRFDDICDHHGVYHVDTIGDSYMVLCGHDGEQDHALRVMRMAADMLELTEQHPLRSTGEHVCVRIGLNTGPAHSGVLGTRRLKYTVWGDSVNCASRMESTGFPGSVQISSHTYQAAVKQMGVLRAEGHANGEAPSMQRSFSRSSAAKRRRHMALFKRASSRASTHGGSCADSCITDRLSRSSAKSAPATEHTSRTSVKSMLITEHTSRNSCKSTTFERSSARSSWPEEGGNEEFVKKGEEAPFSCEHSPARPMMEPPSGVGMEGGGTGGERHAGAGGRGSDASGMGGVPWEFGFVPLGERPIKGKGMVSTYLLKVGEWMEAYETYVQQQQAQQASLQTPEGLNAFRAGQASGYTDGYQAGFTACSILVDAKAGLYRDSLLSKPSPAASGLGQARHLASDIGHSFARSSSLPKAPIVHSTPVSPWTSRQASVADCPLMLQVPEPQAVAAPSAAAAEAALEAAVTLDQALGQQALHTQAGTSIHTHAPQQQQALHTQAGTSIHAHAPQQQQALHTQAGSSKLSNQARAPATQQASYDELHPAQAALKPLGGNSAPLPEVARHSPAGLAHSSSLERGMALDGHLLVVGGGSSTSGTNNSSRPTPQSMPYMPSSPQSSGRGVAAVYSSSGAAGAGAGAGMNPALSPQLHQLQHSPRSTGGLSDGSERLGRLVAAAGSGGFQRPGDGPQSPGSAFATSYAAAAAAAAAMQAGGGALQHEPTSRSHSSNIQHITISGSASLSEWGLNEGPLAASQSRGAHRAGTSAAQLRSLSPVSQAGSTARNMPLRLKSHSQAGGMPARSGLHHSQGQIPTRLATCSTPYDKAASSEPLPPVRIHHASFGIRHASYSEAASSEPLPPAPKARHDRRSLPMNFCSSSSLSSPQADSPCGSFRLMGDGRLLGPFYHSQITSGGSSSGRTKSRSSDSFPQQPVASPMQLEQQQEQQQQQEQRSEGGAGQGQPQQQQQQQQQQSDSREAGIPHAQGPAVSSSEGLCKPSTPALHPRPQERAPPPASSTPPKGENPLRKAVRRLSSKLKLDKGHR